MASSLPVIQLNGNHISSKQGREEGDVEIVQLIDSHLHGGLIHFGVHGWAAGELGRAGRAGLSAGAAGALLGPGFWAADPGARRGAKAAERI